MGLSVTAHFQPKTLAKTLSTIACHAPAEFGLFWDPDGTMPWKEFYWALQEDPGLRFVRESIIRQLTMLGLELPFVLEGTRLRLRPDCKPPSYPPAHDLPERLYFACRRKHYAYVLEHGIIPSSRPFVPLAATKELALRLGRRRDPEPLLLEVLARKAHAEGETIYEAGTELYLAASLPAPYLVFPLLRADQQVALTSRKKPEGRPSPPEQPPTPGSFFVDVHHFEGRGPASDGGPQEGRQKGRKKTDWKREAKKERHKRSL